MYTAAVTIVKLQAQIVYSTIHLIIYQAFYHLQEKYTNVHINEIAALPTQFHAE